MKVGNLPEAWKYYYEALQIALEVEAIPIALDALLGLGDFQAQSGELEEALILFNFVHNHPASEYETKSRAEKIKMNLESNLTSDQVEKLSLTAREFSFDKFLGVSQ